MTKANWYFDFISPFAYLQLARLPELSTRLDITPVPVVFGALLKHWGQLGPAEIPPKRRFTYRFFKWKADQAGLPFTMPPSHPFNPLPALRLFTAAGGGFNHARAVFDVIYGQGIQPDAPEGVDAISKALDIAGPQTVMANASVKDALRQSTGQAIAAGVFGVPTTLVVDQLFWGTDSTEMLLDYLDNSELFATPEMQRISEMPMGLTRGS